MPSSLSDVGVKISELSERKIAAEVPSFELTPPVQTGDECWPEAINSEQSYFAIYLIRGSQPSFNVTM
jgi:hypothetical protein